MDIKDLLRSSITLHASDVHLIPYIAPQFRVHGDLTTAPDYPKLQPADVTDLLYESMTKEQQHLFEDKLIIDYSVTYPEIGTFRVNAMHESKGVSAFFRVIPEKIPTFEDLSLPQVLKRLLILSHGLILVTGPTGSGKSTTLASMIDYINTMRASHIITIEDPIEFIHNSKKSAINQIQVGRDTPDVATSLRASLRQDPDVIMLGEMRDLDTIRLALTAAETGHLVMATLHANSAPLAVNRIIDIFPTDEKNRVRNLLSETLQGIICQTLVKRLSGGRIGAFEIMLATPAVRHLVRQDMIVHMESTIQTSGDIGMCTMEQSLNDLVAKKIISLATAHSTISNWGQIKKEKE